MKKAIFVFGLKWFDKVNGNTYNNAIIYYDDGTTDALGYGYGDCYYQRAKEHLKANNVGIIGDYLQHAYKWTKKSDVKNGYVDD